MGFFVSGLTSMFMLAESFRISISSKILTLLDLTEHNANHIIPSYCHLPVSCRSLFDRCGSIGSCNSQIYS